MSTCPSTYRQIFLGMPGYGEVTAGAADGFWHATRQSDRAVIQRYREGSLLAANFNGLWCDALNLARGGRRIDYFAMQHADVEPERWWLDTLIDELEAHDLDILGAVVPIKDPRGVTSIALAHPSGDPWRTLCRLTMTEVYRLPETFTSKDVGHPILLNTGLWVCRFDEEWAKQVRFTINDRIAFDTKLDRYVAECEPEDWYFSRLLHEMGKKIGATRKVGLNHRGSIQFTGRHAWGQPFDSATVKESPLPQASSDPNGFILPNIDGWLTREEGVALAELACGKRVLEVGSYCGLSTVCLARTAERVVAVDPHDGRGTPAPQATLGRMLANLEEYGVTDKVEVRVETLNLYTLDHADVGCYDLIFIDGAHDAASVQSDIDCALELLAPDGLLAFHDYRSPIDPDVTATVDNLLAAGGELLSLTGTVAVVRPPALIPLLLEA